MPPTRNSHHVERNVAERRYQDPGRARAAIQRAHISPKQKKRLLLQVDEWQNQEQPPVVAGTPPETPPAASTKGAEAHEAESVETSAPEEVDTTGREPLTLNPYARVRVQLTLEGMAALHACKDHLRVPDDLVQRAGVWETTLWEVSHVLASMREGAEPFADQAIVVLDPRPKIPKTIGLAAALFGGLSSMVGLMGEAQKRRAALKEQAPSAEPSA